MTGYQSKKLMAQSREDDLVKRLLAASIYKPAEAESLCEEAADEILHLRARLQDIANFSLHGDYSNAYEMPEIALRALAGKVTKMTQEMNDDLVKRLRAEDPECGLRHSIAMESADRIEQLELALQNIVIHCESDSPPNAEALKLFARAALGEKKDV